MENNLENYIGKILNGNCVEVLKTMPKNTIDLMVTSPPYNCNISYDVHKDDLMMDEYWDWTKQWLSGVFDVLKDDGRVAINIPYETNTQDRGGRCLFVSDFWQIMKQVGFKFFGIVDLEEDSPHRSKTTAWGSWMSPSAPYIYNPKECVVLAYKKNHIKKEKGQPQWQGTVQEVEQEDGTLKKKTVYPDESKQEFMELVFGQWKYLNDSRPLTKATFSMDIPTKAIKILSYKNDVILDPFAGSGTSLVAAEVLDRRWIGIELSPNYHKIARERVGAFVLEKRQQKIEFQEGTI